MEEINMGELKMGLSKKTDKLNEIEKCPLCGKDMHLTKFDAIFVYQHKDYECKLFLPADYFKTEWVVKWETRCPNEIINEKKLGIWSMPCFF